MISEGKHWKSFVIVSSHNCVLWGLIMLKGAQAVKIMFMDLTNVLILDLQLAFP